MLGTLEYDHTVHITPNAGDDALLVKFFMDAALDSVASKDAGRPIFKDVEWIDIRIPGNRDNVVIRQARDKDKQRFPRHYAAFQQRTAGQEKIVGTLLSAWPYPAMTPARVKELDFHNIRTVEQLAGTNDSSGKNLPGFHAMKQAAKAYLALAKEQAPITKMQSQIDSMQALINKQAAMIDKMAGEDEAPAPKKKAKKG